LDWPTHEQHEPRASRRRRSYEDRLTNMKPSSTQFGMRENTASSRQHASRSAVETHSTAICAEDSPEIHQPSSPSERPVTGLENTQDTAAASAATGGERRDENHLLNVREAAELLRVPVFWVYGRMRKRSFERIPAAQAMSSNGTSGLFHDTFVPILRHGPVLTLFKWRIQLPVKTGLASYS
jgi:hypothetical protein